MKTLFLLLLAVAVQAAEDRPAPTGHCVFAADQPVRRYELVLDKVWEGLPVTLHIWQRGDVIGTAWAECPKVPGYAFVVMAGFDGYYGNGAALAVNGATLTGIVAVTLPVAVSEDSVEVKTGTKPYGLALQKFRLTATVAGAQVTGAYESLDPTSKRAPKAAPKGTLSGKVLEPATMTEARNTLAKGADFPMWRNKGDGVGGETGVKLVEDLSQARVVWKSEELIPYAYSEGYNYGDERFNSTIQGGHASPVLADGRVYQFYYIGTPETADPKAVQQAKEYYKSKNKEITISEEYLHRKLAPQADQVVVCLDAQTGRTLWKTVVTADGIYGPGGPTRYDEVIGSHSSKATSHMTPCVGEGPSTGSAGSPQAGSGQARVFAKGSGSNLYCLDAVTGKLLWRVPAATAPRESDHDVCLYADGVFATKTAGGFSGFDAATGKKLWTVRSGVGGRNYAILWKNGDKTRFITPDVHCVEPKTGKVLWSVEHGGKRNCIPCVSETTLLCHTDSGFSAYRIDDQQATKLWTNDKIVGWRTISPVLYREHAWVRAVTPENAAASRARTFCLDLVTGQIKGDALGLKSFSSVIAGDGRLFNGNAAVVFYQNADPAKFVDLCASQGGVVQNCADEMLAVVLQGQPETTPIYADGRLFSRTFDGIICYDLRKP
jgi:outer membrane protein assembly factor BamB